MKLLLALVVSLLAVAALAPAPPAGASRGGPSLTTRAVLSGGTLRWYRVFEPSSHDPLEPTPVLVCFHGGGGNALGAIASYGIPAEAEARGWLAVFPEGSGVNGGFPDFQGQSWNGGDCCGFASATGVDDVLFFEDMLQDLRGDHAVDEDAVFCTGISNGGIMAYRLAVERPDLVRAVAPVAATLETAPPRSPVPVLAIFGAQDSYIPFGGGVGQGGGTSFNSQRESVQPFLAVNWLGGARTVVALNNALLHQFPGGPSGAPTWYFIAEDGGHTWPGSAGLAIDPAEPVHLDTPATPLLFDFFGMFVM